jgi:hypothetical protein
MLKVIRVLSAVVFASTLAAQQFAYRIDQFAGRKIAQDAFARRARARRIACFGGRRSGQPVVDLARVAEMFRRVSYGLPKWD